MLASQEAKPGLLEGGQKASAHAKGELDAWYTSLNELNREESHCGNKTWKKKTKVAVLIWAEKCFAELETSKSSE